MAANVVAIRADNRPSRARGSAVETLTAPPPSWPPMPLDARAEEYAAALWALGTCAASDAFAVAMAADLLARREHLRSVIDAEGWTITTRNGPVMHPAARLLKNAETELLRLLSKLGLDPEARTRLAVSPPSPGFNASALIAAMTGAADD